MWLNVSRINQYVDEQWKQMTAVTGESEPKESNRIQTNSHSADLHVTLLIERRLICQKNRMSAPWSMKSFLRDTPFSSSFSRLFSRSLLSFLCKQLGLLLIILYFNFNISFLPFCICKSSSAALKASLSARVRAVRRCLRKFKECPYVCAACCWHYLELLESCVFASRPSGLFANRIATRARTTVKIFEFIC